MEKRRVVAVDDLVLRVRGRLLDIAIWDGTPSLSRPPKSGGILVKIL